MSIGKYDVDIELDKQVGPDEPAYDEATAARVYAAQVARHRTADRFTMGAVEQIGCHLADAGKVAACFLDQDLEILHRLVSLTCDIALPDEVTGEIETFLSD